ncbi:hypothetical protein CBM2586_A120033 [Cupriavidus phytorum]|uniref:Uncharacterized protein n=1 Tax=Cupriavidus taiwanensis TaxID=164546 RepID=A0A375C1I4_9BURK|nr:hypothetical protein CBM2586_A120033 [Cupriavidus taiwanensis]
MARERTPPPTQQVRPTYHFAKVAVIPARKGEHASNPHRSKWPGPRSRWRAARHPPGTGPLARVGPPGAGRGRSAVGAHRTGRR